MTKALWRRPEEVGRRFLGNFIECLGSTTATASAVSVAIGPGEGLDGKVRDALVVPNVLDGYHRAKYIWDHQQQIADAADYLVAHTPEQLQHMITKVEIANTKLHLFTKYVTLAKDNLVPTPVLSHASYWIDLATASPALREPTLAAFVDELDRAEALGLLGVVIHPGVCTSGTEDAALGLIADAIRFAFKARPRKKTKVLLEHTAGQGRTLGHRFEHLAAIIERVNGSARVGVCLDTCHLVASGYDIVSESGYHDTFNAFDCIVGLERLRAFHGNDSKKPCGSRVDRHEHIGQGCLGSSRSAACCTIHGSASCRS